MPGLGNRSGGGMGGIGEAEWGDVPSQIFAPNIRHPVRPLQSPTAMRHRSFTAACAVSLLFGMGLGVLRVRSYWIDDGVNYARRPPGGPWHDDIYLYGFYGCVPTRASSTSPIFVSPVRLTSGRSL